LTRTKVHGALALSLMLASAAAAAPAAAAKPTPAPLVDGGKRAVPDQYIVVLKKTMTASAVDAVAEAAVSRGGMLRARYSRVLNGFAAKLPGKALEAVRANPAVAYVTPDSIVEPTTDQTNPPSWGLDRIDQRAGLPFLDNLYRYDSTGAGTTVFVVDSGIRATHTDFGGRATGVFDVVGDGHGTDDCANHGTHVAGTIGGTTFGVAKNVQIRAVRVFGCEGNGPSSDLIEGMEFIAGNHPPRSVANFSLSVGDPAAAEALEGLIDAGIHAVVSAGNNNSDACTANPFTTVSRAVTVAASVQGDGRAFFSNFGTCVDVFAPGLDIMSASSTSDTASELKSGTSMAAPHVAGWIARYLQENPTATPEVSLAAIIASSSKGILGYSQIGAGSPNRLLWADPANTAPDTTPPSTPGQPTIGFVTDTEVEVRFPAATDDTAIAGYDMYQRFGGADTLIARLPAGGLSFTPSGLSPGTTYSFYVKARDTAENFSGPSATVTITTAGAHTCRVQYQINGTNPFNANLVITNNGPATITGWRLQFPFADGQQLVPGQTWSATWTQDGNFVTAVNLPWNETITPGSSAYIGFNATQTGTNSVPGFFNFNGVLCTIG